MADTVESTFGTQELVKTVGDPFDFVETYKSPKKALRTRVVDTFDTINVQEFKLGC